MIQGLLSQGCYQFQQLNTLDSTFSIHVSHCGAVFCAHTLYSAPVSEDACLGEDSPRAKLMYNLITVPKQVTYKLSSNRPVAAVTYSVTHWRHFVSWGPGKQLQTIIEGNDAANPVTHSAVTMAPHSYLCTLWGRSFSLVSVICYLLSFRLI